MSEIFRHGNHTIDKNKLSGAFHDLIAHVFNFMPYLVEFAVIFCFKSTVISYILKLNDFLFVCLSTID